MSPYLAEGLAEWATERILQPFTTRYPLLSFGETEKRMSLPPDDPHRLGYALVRVLDLALGSPAEVRALLARPEVEPGQVMRDPRLAQAWKRYAGPDRVIPRRGGISLIPQTSFHLMDELPEVVETLIFPRACESPL